MPVNEADIIRERIARLEAQESAYAVTHPGDRPMTRVEAMQAMHREFAAHETAVIDYEPPPNLALKPKDFKKLAHGQRLKIQNSQVLNRLIQHVEGDFPMLPSQVTAALGLLKKVMPDLAAVADVGEDGGLTKPVQHLSDAELAAILREYDDKMINVTPNPTPTQDDE